MISRERLLDVVSPVAAILPNYHLEVTDINEALDYGEASCAPRTYAAGLLLREAYPNPDLYSIEFGFTDEHGQEHVGKNGTYTRMGHVAVRFFVPGSTPMIVESHTSTLAVLPVNLRYSKFNWLGLDEGYRAYLDKAGFDDVEIVPNEVLSCLLKKIETVD
jgi:hypothetical protein